MAECFRLIDTIILSLIQTNKCTRHSNQVNKLRLKLSGIAETFEITFINCKKHFRKNWFLDFFNSILISLKVVHLDEI